MISTTAVLEHHERQAGLQQNTMSVWHSVMMNTTEPDHKTCTDSQLQRSNMCQQLGCLDLCRQMPVKCWLVGETQRDLRAGCPFLDTNMCLGRIIERFLWLIKLMVFCVVQAHSSISQSSSCVPFSCYENYEYVKRNLTCW